MTKKLIAYVAVEIRDKNDRLIYSEKKEANSLVKHFINALYCQAANTSLANQKSWDDSLQTISSGAGCMQMLGAAGATNTGIVVGTGTTPVSILDTKLVTLILHGTTATKLSYSVETISVPATVDSTHSFTLARSFLNQSGADITVNEVGIFGNGQSTMFLFDRTLMSFVIVNGATGTVTYTIQASV